jgi:hypothetical protein
MSKQEEREAQRSYSVPDTRDVPKRWADGPNAGKLVHKTPMKVRSLKLDPDEHDVRLSARRLAAMGDVGRLEIDAAWAEKVAIDKKNAYEMAVMLKENGHLRRQYVPPSRWPTIALVTVLVLLATLQAANLWRAQHPTPGSSAGGQDPPVSQELTSEEPRKGRAR